MTEIIALISAVVVGLISAVASVLAAKASNDKMQAVLTERLDNYRNNTDEKIDDLREHVEKHNGLVERMVVQELNTDNQWKRIDELRADVNKIKEAS